MVELWIRNAEILLLAWLGHLIAGPAWLRPPGLAWLTGWQFQGLWMRTGFPPWQHEWISSKLCVVVVVVIASDLMHAAAAVISIALVVLILFFLIFYILVVLWCHWCSGSQGFFTSSLMQIRMTKVSGYPSSLLWLSVGEDRELWVGEVVTGDAGEVTAEWSGHRHPWTMAAW